MKKRVLVLCTHNASRSQMAEGLFRRFAGDRLEVYSAGSQPSIVHPLAVQAMALRGIDIRQQHSKHLDAYRRQPFDYVITVCDQAAETCPIFPGVAERIHWSFPDPSAVQGSDAERLDAFVRVRDALESQICAWLDSLTA